MKITAHCVVKNEDIWVWYAINSVLPFVDKILLFDTGSTDRTVEIIHKIKSPKIIFEEKGEVNREELVELRREQLKRTKTDWFLILDGDEIWPEGQLRLLINKAEKASSSVVALFNHARNCIGDIYHYLPEELGQYNIAGVKGNLNIRLIRKTPDLKLEGVYPLESYYNKNGPIQNQDENLIHVNCWYLHTTFLKRSTGDFNKVSGSFGRSKVWEKGMSMKRGELPEVLFKERPKQVLDPFKKRGKYYELMANLVSPIVQVKRARKNA